jgi:hypothetical protein
MNAGARRRLAACVIAFAATAAVAGCRYGGTSYIPLDAGWRYGYLLHLESEGTEGAAAFKSVAVNLPRREVAGVRATPRLFEDGRILYYTEDDTGLRAAAFQEPGEEATAAAPGQYLLRYPLEAGSRWQTPGRTVLLTQRFLYSKALPVTIGIDLDYTVEKVGETVRVPAGRFANCIKLVAIGHTTVNTADNQKTLDVSVDISEWYARGVGLIKSERTERAGDERAGNARLSTELEYLDKPSWFD